MASPHANHRRGEFESSSTLARTQCTRVALGRGAQFQLHCQTHNAYGALRDSLAEAQADWCPIIKARAESDRNWFAGIAARLGFSLGRSRTAAVASVVADGGHLTAAVLAAWVDRRLTPDEDRAVAGHLARCPECLEWAKEACIIADGARA
jgi:hypothetical protein